MEISVKLLEQVDKKFVAFLRDISRRKARDQVQAGKLELLNYAIHHNSRQLLQKFLDYAERFTRSSIGFYHFVEPDQKTLSLQTWSTNTLENMCTAEGDGLHYPVSQAGVWVDCIRERMPVVHNDYATLGR